VKANHPKEDIMDMTPA